MLTSTDPDSPQNLDLDWAHRELIPFLKLIFGETYGHENRPTVHWLRMVLFARLKLNRIVSTPVLRFYFWRCNLRRISHRHGALVDTDHSTLGVHVQLLSIVH